MAEHCRNVVKPGLWHVSGHVVCVRTCLFVAVVKIDRDIEVAAAFVLVTMGYILSENSFRQGKVLFQKSFEPTAPVTSSLFIVICAEWRAGFVAWRGAKFD